MLKNGESVAGLTVHVMTEKIDAGAIVAQQELIIGENENAGQLTQRQHHAAAALLTEAVNAMAQGTLDLKPQNIAERTYFGKKKASRHRSGLERVCETNCKSVARVTTL